MGSSENNKNMQSYIKGYLLGAFSLSEYLTKQKDIIFGINNPNSKINKTKSFTLGIQKGMKARKKIRLLELEKIKKSKEKSKERTR